MAKSSSTQPYALGANVDGLKETLRALRGIDKEANNAIRNETQKIANMMASEIAAAGRSRSKRDAFVGDSFRGTRERTPVVKGRFSFTHASVACRCRATCQRFDFWYGVWR
jgi:hypothetical protein